MGTSKSMKLCSRLTPSMWANVEALSKRDGCSPSDTLRAALRLFHHAPADFCENFFCAARETEVCSRRVCLYLGPEDAEALERSMGVLKRRFLRMSRSDVLRSAVWNYYVRTT